MIHFPSTIKSTVDVAKFIIKEEMALLHSSVEQRQRSGVSAIRDALLSEKCIFFNIVQKAFDPTPLSFEHHVFFMYLYLGRGVQGVKI